MIMRGSTPNHAKAIAEQRQIARNELVVLHEKKEEEKKAKSKTSKTS